ncbi:HET-domain-containing protein [Dendrothele bispora CBS 962.96]|uniref:HET-domain-containing protein n=1 Tax=Dendrothele bispora (strain CBS 962.96) TaxID=1314807 RepID=A0A4V4HFZ3_DENBC|nr:HET-domain-containing protein [Dendrothele bispora CBS 962.96]
MRLLNTSTFKLDEFDIQIPKYAILSHTWTNDEVSFRDIKRLEFTEPEDTVHGNAIRDVEALAQKEAKWRKVMQACAYARMHKFQWIWIDCCCINKESSAELSEAINSMYQYYLEAAICYVYLSDVSGKEKRPEDANSPFRFSRWFTRGWTLQELLAPRYLVFLDNTWTEIGTKWSLHDVISAITSIPSRVLEDGDVSRYSVAQKMSWAACRQTTRPEDQAYCLMGLFGVNMPPIYGEGSAKAFTRLQQQIIELSDDRSIFAWIASVGEMESRGLLARSPCEFRSSREVGISKPDSLGLASSYSLTNSGLHIHLPLTPIESNLEGDLFLAYLNCQSEKDGCYLSVYLRRTTDGRYIRSRASELHLSPSCRPKDLQELLVANIPPSRSKSVRQCDVKLLSFTQSRTVVDTQSYWETHSSELATASEEAVCISYLDNSWTERAVGLLVYPTNGSENRLLVSTRHNSDDIPRLRFQAVFKSTNPDIPPEPSRVKIPTPDTQIARVAFSILRTIWAWFSVTSPHAMTCHEAVLEDNHSGVVNHLSSAVDRALTCLESGGFIALDLHLTATNPELEVRYLGEGDTRIPLLKNQLMVSPKWDWLVPIEIESLSLKTIFPPDYFQTKYDKKTFVSMPASGEADMYRMLIYSSDRLAETIFVALGFNDSKPWVDVGVSAFSNGAQSNTEEIWKSYLDGGQRASHRLRPLASNSCRFRDGTLTVTAAKRDRLQLSSHNLLVKWQRYG